MADYLGLRVSDHKGTNSTQRRKVREETYFKTNNRLCVFALKKYFLYKYLLYFALIYLSRRIEFLCTLCGEHQSASLLSAGITSMISTSKVTA